MLLWARVDLVKPHFLVCCLECMTLKKEEFLLMDKI